MWMLPNTNIYVICSTVGLIFLTTSLNHQINTTLWVSCNGFSAAAVLWPPGQTSKNEVPGSSFYHLNLLLLQYIYAGYNYPAHILQ